MNATRPLPRPGLPTPGLDATGKACMIDTRGHRIVSSQQVLSFRSAVT